MPHMVRRGQLQSSVKPRKTSNRVEAANKIPQKEYDRGCPPFSLKRLSDLRFHRLVVSRWSWRRNACADRKHNRGKTPRLCRMHKSSAFDQDIRNLLDRKQAKHLDLTRVSHMAIVHSIAVFLQASPRVHGLKPFSDRMAGLLSSQYWFPRYYASLVRRLLALRWLKLRREAALVVALVKQSTSSARL